MRQNKYALTSHCGNNVEALLIHNLRVFFAPLILNFSSARGDVSSSTMA